MSAPGLVPAVFRGRSPSSSTANFAKIIGHWDIFGATFKFWLYFTNCTFKAHKASEVVAVSVVLAASRVRFTAPPDEQQPESSHVSSREVMRYSFLISEVLVKHSSLIGNSRRGSDLTGLQRDPSTFILFVVCLSVAVFPPNSKTYRLW